MHQLDLIPHIVKIEAHNSGKAHNLKRSGTRPYTLRLTIDQGPKFVGKRISMSLGTRDHAEALRISGMLITILEKSNFLVSGSRIENEK